MSEETECIFLTLCEDFEPGDTLCHVCADEEWKVYKVQPEHIQSMNDLMREINE